MPTTVQQRIVHISKRHRIPAKSVDRGERGVAAGEHLAGARAHALKQHDLLASGGNRLQVRVRLDQHVDELRRGQQHRVGAGLKRDDVLAQGLRRLHGPLHPLGRESGLRPDGREFRGSIGKCRPVHPRIELIEVQSNQSGRGGASDNRPGNGGRVGRIEWDIGRRGKHPHGGKALPMQCPLETGVTLFHM